MAGDGVSEKGSPGHLPGRLIVGVGNTLERWLAFPVAVTLFSAGLGIFLATFDVPRTAPFVDQIWPLVSAFVVAVGFDTFTAYACRCLPCARSLVIAVSASVWIVVVWKSIFMHHANSMCLAFCGLSSLRSLWTRRRG